MWGTITLNDPWGGSVINRSGNGARDVFEILGNNSDVTINRLVSEDRLPGSVVFYVQANGKATVNDVGRIQVPAGVTFSQLDSGAQLIVNP